MVVEGGRSPSITIPLHHSAHSHPPPNAYRFSICIHTCINMRLYTFNTHETPPACARFMSSTLEMASTTNIYLKWRGGQVALFGLRRRWGKTDMPDSDDAWLRAIVSELLVASDSAAATTNRWSHAVILSLLVQCGLSPLCTLPTIHTIAAVVTSEVQQVLRHARLQSCTCRMRSEAGDPAIAPFEAAKADLLNTLERRRIGRSLKAGTPFSADIPHPAQVLLALHTAAQTYRWLIT